MMSNSSIQLKQDIDHILDLYTKGTSAGKLSTKYSIDKRKIIKFAKEKGVFRDIGMSHRKIMFNQNFFDLIDTENKAYWLGFVMAAGYNYNGTLLLSVDSNNENLLKQFCQTINYPIENIKIKNNKKQSRFITLTSKHLTDTLNNHGHLGKDIIIPAWLDGEYYINFMLGYLNIFIDIAIKNKKYKINISGTNTILKSFSLLLNKHNIIFELSNKIILKDINSIYKLYKVLTQSKNYHNFIHSTAITKIIKDNGFVENISNTNIIVISEQEITASYLRSIDDAEKEKLIDPIFNIFKKDGFIYPNSSDEKLINDYNSLIKYNIDPNILEINNNFGIGTNICRHFCSKSFYNSAEEGYEPISKLWYNEELLKKVIKNRMGIGWKNDEDEVFDITHNNMITGFRNSRVATIVSIFKPQIAKYMCLRYSNEGDIVGDYSCGFGARLLGAMATNRKYIGTDPLTVPELQNMANFFDFKDCKLIQSGSENYRGEENSVDLYWSSPPYFNQEVYSYDQSQAYIKGPEYFYQIYWKKTLENVKYMLKPGKWFGLNVKNYPKMLEMAQYYFGDIVEQVALKTRRSPLTKAAGDLKYEYIYMFKNPK